MVILGDSASSSQKLVILFVQMNFFVQFFHALMLGRLLSFVVPSQVIMRRAKRKLELTYNVIGRDDVDLETHGPASTNSPDLRSMIMFGVNTLHKSDDSKDMKVSENSELKDIVDAALTQRGKAGSALSSPTEFGNVGVVTLDSQDDQAENFYNYEGKDFTKVRIWIVSGVLNKCIMVPISSLSLSPA